MTATDALAYAYAQGVVGLALLAGVIGGVLALSVWALIQAAWRAVVAGLDERQARKRLAARHYAELFGPQSGD